MVVLAYTCRCPIHSDIPSTSILKHLLPRGVNTNGDHSTVCSWAFIHSTSIMSISNPSHLLISRNPRSPAIPQLAPTLLTSRHSPSSSLPSNLLGSWSLNSDDAGPSAAHWQSASSTSDDQDAEDGDQVIEEDIEVHPTFRQGAALPGRVKVLVGRYQFWCHKDILWFASPFFQSLLEGK